MEVRNTHPVLLVHGLWDSAARLAPLVRGLAARGVEPLATVDLRPSDGRAPIATLGEQVCARADAVRAEHGCEHRSDGDGTPPLPEHVGEPSWREIGRAHV